MTKDAREMIKFANIYYELTLIFSCCLGKSISQIWPNFIFSQCNNHDDYHYFYMVATQY